MRHFTHCLLIAICIVLLGGCAHYSLVQADRQVVVGNALRVDPQMEWSMREEEGITTWTADGPLLQRLMFFSAIENGRPLVRQGTGRDDDKEPLFSSTMTPVEIMELVEATLVRMGAHGFEKEKLMPAKFGQEEGFRFSFSFANKEGLQHKGFAAGAVKKGKLYLVMYMGAALHHYGKYEPQAERVVQSVEIL